MADYALNAITSCGLTLDAVQRIMVDRVTVWAAAKRARRLARNPLDKAEGVITDARQRRAAIHGPVPWVAGRR